jgi:hypothetical protein
MSSLEDCKTRIRGELIFLYNNHGKVASVINAADYRWMD